MTATHLAFSFLALLTAPGVPGVGGACTRCVGMDKGADEGAGECDRSVPASHMAFDL